MMPGSDTVRVTDEYAVPNLGYPGSFRNADGVTCPCEACQDARRRHPRHAFGFLDEAFLQAIGTCFEDCFRSFQYASRLCATCLTFRPTIFGAALPGGDDLRPCCASCPTCCTCAYCDQCDRRNSGFRLCTFCHHFGWRCDLVRLGLCC